MDAISRAIRHAIKTLLRTLLRSLLELLKIFLEIMKADTINPEKATRPKIPVSRNIRTY